MSEKITFSPNLTTDQPNFLVKRSSGDIDVMVPTGKRMTSSILNPDGSETVRYKHEMRGQLPVEGTSSFYETKFMPEASLQPDAQEKLAESLAGVAPSASERHERGATADLQRALGARSIDTAGMIQMPKEWRTPKSNERE